MADDALDLGCFSVSLAVQDLERSLRFYEALGFRVVGGDGPWRILANGSTKLGLFEGMFDKNVLTFNPGLAQSPDAQPGADGAPEPVAGFTDVREIERRLTEAGIDIERRTESDSGPDHLTLVDPDGNPVLIDQFF